MNAPHKSYPRIRSRNTPHPHHVTKGPFMEGNNKIYLSAHTKLHKSFLKMTQGIGQHMLFHSDTRNDEGFAEIGV